MRSAALRLTRRACEAGATVLFLPAAALLVAAATLAALERRSTR